MKSDEAEDLGGELLELMNSRSHISPKRLGAPGPNLKHKELILSAAGTAPIHGAGIPWHIYEISDELRHSLGNVFVESLKARYIDATPEQIEESFSKALRGPYLLLIVARHGLADQNIPRNENVISAGCAIQNMLLTAHAMGFGAGISSGNALYGPEIKAMLKLGVDDEPLAFLTIGSVIKHRDHRVKPAFSKYTSFL